MVVSDHGSDAKRAPAADAAVVINRRGQALATRFEGEGRTARAEGRGRWQYLLAIFDPGDGHKTRKPEHAGCSLVALNTTSNMCAFVFMRSKRTLSPVTAANVSFAISVTSRY